MDGFRKNAIGGRFLRKFLVMCGGTIRHPQILLQHESPPSPHRRRTPSKNIEADNEDLPRNQHMIMTPVQVWASDGDILELPGLNKSNNEVLDEQTASYSQHDNDELPDPLSLEHGEFLRISHEINILPAKIPLNARLPEVIMYVGEDGREFAALALTEMMVYLWNQVLNLEDKINGDTKAILDVAEHQAILHTRFKELDEATDNIPKEAVAESGPHETFFRQAVEEMDGLFKQSNELDKEKDRLATQIQENQGRLDMPKEMLYNQWREIMETYSLTEKENSESIHAKGHVEGQQQPQEDIFLDLRPEEYTASEIERLELVNTRDAALNTVHEKEQKLHEAQVNLDSWEIYYKEEYQRYRAWVNQGNMTERTVFDQTLLQRQRKCIQKLQKAEKSVAEARKHARSLGLPLHSQSQESEFADFPDDGYRESIEAQEIARVDREGIQRWMCNDDLENSSECDKWSSQEVGVSDSVSVVAIGKDREKIDRWRSRCDQLAITYSQFQKNR